MFEQTAIRLLEGAFICESTAPEAFRWLNSEHAQAEVGEYLGKLGRKLTMTPNRLAYYATWARVGKGEQTEIKKVFAHIKQTIRPVMHFLSLCMESGRQDSAPSPGDLLDYATLLSQVTSNQHFGEMLRAFGTMGKEFAVSDASTMNGMLNKVIVQMERWGYLIAVNREHETYRFTGKLDYYYQVIDFLLENEPITDSAALNQEPEPDQGRLL
ncbi:condensin complex protein MksE [Aromatoleum evansii]|jgi:hypothetical protein|uniref:condensin complex protein MksE n=1 Tax=Aromatoleum evansii TaxID=59406 RepID=UPI00145E42E5|nr:hypothetical protein [Aromatoleum evansii]NMG30568.1 hypothetical protein [Aromatoleum evansii]